MDERERGAAGEHRISGSNGHRVQVRTVRKHEFTKEKRQLFLNALAATCNVKAAARAAGVGATAVHRLRRLSPEFAALWAEALEIGYQYLEEQLLARAIEGLDAMAIDPDAAPVAPLPPITDPIDGAGKGEGERGEEGDAPRAIGLAAIPGKGLMTGRGLPAAYQLALQMLSQRRAAQRDGMVTRRKIMSTEEVDALLVAKLDRLDRLDAARATRTKEAGAPSEAGAGGAA